MGEAVAVVWASAWETEAEVTEAVRQALVLAGPAGATASALAQAPWGRSALEVSQALRRLEAWAWRRKPEPELPWQEACTLRWTLPRSMGPVGHERCVFRQEAPLTVAEDFVRRQSQELRRAILRERSAEERAAEAGQAGEAAALAAAVLAAPVGQRRHPWAAERERQVARAAELLVDAAGAQAALDAAGAQRLLARRLGLPLSVVAERLAAVGVERAHRSDRGTLAGYRPEEVARIAATCATRGELVKRLGSSWGSLAHYEKRQGPVVLGGVVADPAAVPPPDAAASPPAADRAVRAPGEAPAPLRDELVEAVEILREALGRAAGRPVYLAELACRVRRSRALLVEAADHLVRLGAAERRGPASRGVLWPAARPVALVLEESRAAVARAEQIISGGASASAPVPAEPAEVQP